MISLLTGALVAFREGFEALLLTMLLTGMVRSRGLDWRALILGLAAGIAGSAVMAYLIYLLGPSVEWFNAAISLATAMVLTYVVLWNAKVQEHINEHLDEVKAQNLWVMMLTTAAIFLREGAEIAVMLQGAAASDPIGAGIGIGIGLVGLTVLGILIEIKLLTGPRIGQLFKWSNYILGAMAIYFYYDGIHEALEYFGVI
jgi:FTR1 family protein